MIDAVQLVQAVADGNLATGFVWRCTTCDGPLAYADRLELLPDRVACPVCGERELQFHVDDVEVVYRGVNV